MTIIAGFNSSRQGRAPLHLAVQIARCTGDKIIATAIVERRLPRIAGRVEDEYYQYVTSQASRSLEHVVSELRNERNEATDAVLVASQPPPAALDRAEQARARFGSWHFASLLVNFVTILLVTATMALAAALPDQVLHRPGHA